jgi:lactate dehydrogenase-like 2-hydroxyacid dehydrogenase
MHHTIVVLEGIHGVVPEFTIPPPHTATTIVHHFTQPEEIIDRIRDATIVVDTTRRLTAAILDPAATPKLQLIAQTSTGVDNIDLEACKKRGLTVSSCPAANIDSVAEHAIALYFATRRSIPLMNSRLLQSEWKQSPSLTKYMRDGAVLPPLTCREEVCGIIGYGNLGRRIAQLAQGLGMEVLVAGRKNGPASEPVEDLRTIGPIDLADPQRTSFATVLKRATVLMILVPLNLETRNLISTPEIAQMQPAIVIINCARGGIVDEAALAEALKEKRVAGAAADVFALEPTGKDDSPLLNLPETANFIGTPHVAWFSQLTIKNLTSMVKENVESFIAGKPTRVII